MVASLTTATDFVMQMSPLLRVIFFGAALLFTLTVLAGAAIGSVHLYRRQQAKQRTMHKERKAAGRRQNSVEHPPERRGPRRGVVAEDRARYQDTGSTFYDSLDEDIHLSDDAEASTESSKFGKRQEPESKPESKPDEEVN